MTPAMTRTAMFCWPAVMTSVLPSGAAAATGTVTADAEQVRRAVLLETDPLAPALRGVGLELAYAYGKHRPFVEFVALDVPDFVASDSRFRERRRAIVGAGYSYFLLRQNGGPFVGADVSVSAATITSKATEEAARATTVRIGPRFGWTFYPFRSLGFLVSPWVSPRIALNPEDVAVGPNTFRQRAFDLVGAVHLGWRFDL